MTFTHRATALPGASPDRDRVVLCDGVEIGRVYEIRAGQNKGEWLWSSYWCGSQRGRAETLEQGLAELKSRVTADAMDSMRRRHDRLNPGIRTRSQRRHRDVRP